MGDCGTGGWATLLMGPLMFICLPPIAPWLITDCGLIGCRFDMCGRPVAALFLPVVASGPGFLYPSFPGPYRMFSLSLSLSLPVSLALLLSPPHSPPPCLPGGLRTEPLRLVSLLIQLSFLCLPLFSSALPVYHNAGTSSRYGTVNPAGSRWLISQLIAISSPFSRLISRPASPPFAAARLVGWR